MAKNKEKKKGIIYYSLYLIFLILIVLFFKNNFFDQKIDMSDYTISIQNILDNYSDYVIVEKKSFLYTKENNTYKKVAIVDKGIIFELERIKDFSLNSIYFQIKDSSYYIHYQNVNPLKEYNPIEKIDYIPLNEKIETMNHYSLIQNTGEKITFSESRVFLVEYLCDNGYVVKWQNELYKISMEDVK